MIKQCCRAALVVQKYLPLNFGFLRFTLCDMAAYARFSASVVLILPVVVSSVVYILYFRMLQM